jgi:phytoene dehydrogenase-like protein
MDSSRSRRLETETVRGAHVAPSARMRDVVIIGSGPNGLAAAAVCARAGRQVTVYEAEEEIGGGLRTAALTLPGFLHDHCASVFPFGAASPFFRQLPLEAYGHEWVHPMYPLAHPLEDGDAVVLERSLQGTASMLGVDGGAYERLLGPFVRDWEALANDVLAPPRLPARPLLLARLGLTGWLPATLLARRFRSPRTRALIAGLAAHSGERLDAPMTAAFALLFATFGHAVGWPVARGGASSIAGALATCVRAHGGTIRTGVRVEDLATIPSSIVLCDLAPEHVAEIAGRRLPDRFARRLRRLRRTGAVFKVDWALREPIPWRAESCRHAGTVHVGGSIEEIAASEAAMATGRLTGRPFVLVAQPSVCDPLRAPAGQHAAWGYCHVPLGCTADLTSTIEMQVERFAPGFRDVILARHTMGPADLLRSNANLVEGDISGGAMRWDQLFTRPTWRQYRTPLANLFLCSSSTPPGPGVHGMCGYWGALKALRAFPAESHMANADR